MTMTTSVNVLNPGASAEAIQHHYDVSNDFYRLWLDPTSTYSSALWEENDNLESAQLRKIDFHINQARAIGAKRVLDVGCGWGSTLKRLVEMHNIDQAVGLTLSKAQAEWIESLNQPQIEVQLKSWSDYLPEEPFDAIISIGAFEHFAKLELSEEQKIERYRTFFQRCHEWLKSSGYMSLQTIVYENSQREDVSQFFAEEIFPESDLPHLAEIAKATEKIFEVVALRNDRKHYERTLRAWLKNLKANRKEAVNLVGERVVARYEKYLSFCIIGFHTGTMNLSRITLRRIDHPRK
ncbi:MAG: cyclopropane-fatty-acyl-phospholipid synthase family protein [Calothrix sp. MO_167.B12]|nr:cyclopropane-fatty-acyl-phospholipid synthase family protein [Calothrix sp. MO_167.B12]